MKKSVKAILRRLWKANVRFWSGLDLDEFDRRKEACIAYRSGWCTGGTCHLCDGMTDEEADLTRQRLAALRYEIRELRKRRRAEKAELESADDERK